MKRKEVLRMPSILYEVRSGVAHVTLNREEALHSLNTLMIQRLSDVIQDISSNIQVHVVIISGLGKRSFCVGADMNDPTFQSAADLIDASSQFSEMLISLEELEKPTIAAINGYAFGAGLELALACDFRIAVDQTLLGLPETKLGIIPGGGGTQRLPRLIGEPRAMELILTGKRITSMEAYQYGLLSKVVPPEKLEVEALNLAEALLSNGPVAVRKAKHAIKKGMKTDFRTGLELEKSCFQAVAHSEDRLEGLGSFLEKKPPNFKGK
ncbi:enoyl-CoA hydratase-related protein [Peribacillus sp. SCS-155]|uniref:enoyl-CoA hydratase-related protein n=1 Tax=Peribacillus sedimenti TaxID=3115297 RepID=UPI00390607A6